MAYKPGIPQPTDDMGATSQGEILENFTQLDSQFGTNHVAFSAAADNGKHSHVTFIRLDPTDSATDAALTPGEDEAIIYAAESDSDTELYFRQFGLAGQQFTKGGSVFVGAVPAAAANFTVFGGIGACVVNSEYNLGGAGAISQTHASNAEFTATFDAALPDANYYWTISGMRTAAGSLVGIPKEDATYSSVVTTTSFKFKYITGAGGNITDLLRGTLVIWRMQ